MCLIGYYVIGMDGHSCEVLTGDLHVRNDTENLSSVSIACVPKLFATHYRTFYRYLMPWSLRSVCRPVPH